MTGSFGPVTFFVDQDLGFLRLRGAMPGFEEWPDLRLSCSRALARLILLGDSFFLAADLRFGLLGALSSRDLPRDLFDEASNGFHLGLLSDLPSLAGLAVLAGFSEVLGLASPAGLR